MSEVLTPEEILTIEYKSPLDVAQLFTDDRLSYTINYIFAKFIDMTNEARELRTEYVEGVVFSEKLNVFNMDYGFLVDRLGELFDNKKGFYRDFGLNFDDTKNAEFLVCSVLEEMLGIVKLNNTTMFCQGRKEITYRRSFMKSCVYNYKHYMDSSERFVQLNCVPFKLSAVHKLLNEEVLTALKAVVVFSDFKLHPNCFGQKACSEFWRNLSREAQYFSLVSKL